jgi:hypothetical protein
MGVKLSLSLRDKHRSRVFENRMLSKLSKKDEGTGDWKRQSSFMACSILVTKYYSVIKSKLNGRVA